ncbi:methyltransferase [Geodermatophilus bullaregiensis]|uniref:methyltransferase n=1 Tax=Geodermatophilus bullaregiensis TaxID=1564160 RepID=UPI001956CE7C
MDRARLSAVAHRWHPVAAPVSDEGLRRLLERLAPPGHGRVLDLGCGSGAWLLPLLAASPGLTGVGVDTSAPALDAARDRAAMAGLVRQVDLVQADAAGWRGGTFDVVVCIGATHVFGGPAGTLAALRGHLRPGGRLLFGDAFWEAGPSPRALAGLGAGPASSPTCPGCWPRSPAPASSRGTGTCPRSPSGTSTSGAGPARSPTGRSPRRPPPTSGSRPSTPPAPTAASGSRATAASWGSSPRSCTTRGPDSGVPVGRRPWPPTPAVMCAECSSWRPTCAVGAHCCRLRRPPWSADRHQRPPACEPGPAPGKQRARRCEHPGHDDGGAPPLRGAPPSVVRRAVRGPRGRGRVGRSGRQWPPASWARLSEASISAWASARPTQLAPSTDLPGSRSL